VPDKTVLQNIFKEHPLSKNLWTSIKNLTIQLSPGPSEEISFDIVTTDAILFLFRDTASKPEYEFILYHEFSHVADKLNPKFNFSEKKLCALKEIEQAAVKTIWDCYINARLNEKHLIPDGYAKTDQRNRIDYLESCFLMDAQGLFQEIWNNPSQSLSFDDLINKVLQKRKN
jgi:hypothetical protein